LLLGIADAMVGAYFVLFQADVMGLAPVQIGFVASVQAVGGIVVSWLLGQRFDRRPTRAYVVAVTGLGGLGLVLVTWTRSFPLLVLLALTLLGGVAAAFPQLFAMARVILGDGPSGRRSAPVLRSAWSLAWALGPLLGAALLARNSFTLLFWSAAATLGVTALATLAAGSPRRGARDDSVETAGVPARGAPGRFAVPLLVAAVTLFFTAMYAGSVALPLFVTRGLHQPASAVGVLFSICAAVEVAASLGLAAIPVRVSQRLIILAGMGMFVIYFLLTVVADGMPLLLAGQAARGIAIAVVGAAGIRYFQDLLTPATGRATTLFANASTAGSLVAGVLAGGAVALVGYRTTLLLCGITAAAAALSFTAGDIGASRRNPPRSGISAK
jgi:SET family sugar efflux transporter-like MFS transporter